MKTIDDKTKEQLSLIERKEPFKGQKIRIMPDCHSGKGCVIGFTSTLGGKVIPNVVGVDIGCGVMWECIEDETINLKALDEFIKENIPCGKNVGKPNDEFIKSEIARLKAEGRQKEIQAFLKEYKAKECSMPKDLCYLEGEDMEDYLHDMRICQEFAHLNRRAIMDKILSFIWRFPFSATLLDYDHPESVHNYIDFEDRIIRKGAIKAAKGKDVIIPLNMRDGCILGLGKGNEDWNCSAPHGAGRLMSRGEARRELKLSDFKNTMNGIYTTTATEGTIDESPMAYKNAKEIIDIVKDTVSIVEIIKPIYNFKAEE